MTKEVKINNVENIASSVNFYGETGTVTCKGIKLNYFLTSKQK